MAVDHTFEDIDHALRVDYGLALTSSILFGCRSSKPSGTATHWPTSTTVR